MKTITKRKLNFTAIITWLFIAFLSLLVFNGLVGLAVYILGLIFNL